LALPIVTLDVASDDGRSRIWWFGYCDVHPTGVNSLRVSYGVLNLTHREGHERPRFAGARERYPRAH